MKRARVDNINTREHWNKSHSRQTYPYPGYDTYLSLFYYYIPLLEQLEYIKELGGNSILDYGCGNADRFKIIDLSHIRYSGYDFVSQVIEYNRSTFPEIDWYDNIRDIKEQPDFVICIHVLEHLDDPQQTLIDLLSVAKRGVFIQVPYRKSYLSDQHICQFDEQSFEVPSIEPIVIPGLQMNLSGDLEMFMGFIKNRPSNDRVVLDLYRHNMSPQAWFLKYAQNGFVNYYFNQSYKNYLKTIVKKILNYCCGKLSK